MGVPGGERRFDLSGTCVPACTGAGLPGPITVFGSQLHTHGAGRAVQTVVASPGSKQKLLNRDPHYSTHFQEIRVLAAAVRVKPGDALITTCTYDTTDRTNITLGGQLLASACQSDPMEEE